MTSEAQTPVFIIGTGRCGSTMLHDAMCHHDDICWLTPLADRYPWRPQLNASALKHAKRLLSKSMVRRLLPPVEPYRFFENCYSGFSTPYRDLSEDDFRPGASNRFRGRVAAASIRGQQFIAKYTGWSRIGLLRQVFPAAKFLHIVRDGRAVVNSVLKAGYFDGWAGPQNWCRGALSDRQERAWRDSGESFVILAAIGWENRIESFAVSRQELPDEQFMEIRYEDFCEEPRARAEEILAFMGLPDTGNERFFRSLSKMRFRSANDGWQRDLTEKQQEQLSSFLAEKNASFGY